ncbi:MAG: DNA alkylation repair protein [Flavobacteriales bacterium]
MGRAAPSTADVKSVVAWLESRGSKKAREEMGPRYGIWTDKAFGVAVGELRKMAKDIGQDHAFAQKLWANGWYEARMLACMVDDPAQVTPAQMDAWCKDFDNWGIVDTVCFCLFDRVPHAFKKVQQWAKRKSEFEKRAAFALLASLALHDKKTEDAPFLKCLPLIETAANDDRNFVKKGVSWALRAMAVRSTRLRDEVIAFSERLAASDDTTERWIGKDVLRDVKRPLVAKRVASREKARSKK